METTAEEDMRPPAVDTEMDYDRPCCRYNTNIYIYVTNTIETATHNAKPWSMIENPGGRNPGPKLETIVSATAMPDVSRTG
jgi:hypothetical protein